jgi:hypothetical protein
MSMKRFNALASAVDLRTSKLALGCKYPGSLRKGIVTTPSFHPRT